MDLDSLKLKLEDLGVESSDMDEGFLVDWLNEINQEKDINNKNKINELESKLIALELERDKEKDWRRKAKLQAKIISTKFDF